MGKAEELKRVEELKKLKEEGKTIKINNNLIAVIGKRRVGQHL